MTLQAKLTEFATRVGQDIKPVYNGRLSAYCKTITDWNAAIETGFYVGNDAANAPTPGLWYIGSSYSYSASWGTQEVHQFTGDSSTDTITYRRERNGGTWGAWYRVRKSEGELDARYVQSADGQPLPTGLIVDGKQSVRNLANSGAYFDFMDDLGRWQTYTGIAPTSLTSTFAVAGSKVMQATGYTWQIAKERMPFDPTKLYKVTFRVLRYGSAGGVGGVYAGLTGFAANGSTYVSVSGGNTGTSAHYCAAVNYSQASMPNGEWVEFVGYVKGHATSGTVGLGTLDNPAKMHTDVRYISAMVALNYSTGTDDMRVDSARIEVVSEEGFVKANGSGWTPHPDSFRDGQYNAFYTDFGFIKLGPANANYAHVYTDQPAFYFNKDIQVLGNLVRHASNTPDGTDAQALAGTDTTKRVWTAVSLGQAVKGYNQNVIKGPPNLLALDPTIDISGASDISAKLQAAINSVSNTTILLPPGYFPANNINLKPGVHLEGAGEYQTIMRPVSNSAKIFQYNAAATVNDIGLRKLGFDVNGKTNVTAIHLDGTDSAKRISGLNLKDLRISGAFVRGVYMRYCVNSGLQNIYQILVHDAFQLVESADSNLDDCEAQLGDGYGFLIQGGVGAFDEGVRMTKCITNGQAYGLSVSGQGWGNAAACSFTTAPSGPLVLAGAENWDFAACEFSTAGGTPAAPAAQMDSACLDIGFSSCKFILSTFGLILGGYRHNVIGCRFKANSNVDLQLNDASLCTAHGNTLDSTGSAYSISEGGTSDANSFVGNIENGLENIIGANSDTLGRIQY